MRVWNAGLPIVAALLACQSQNTRGTAATCNADTDCTSGFLCESAHCVPEDVARKARTPQTSSAPASAASAPATPPPEPTPSVSVVEAPGVDERGVPPVPTERTPVPQGNDWNEGTAVNTQGANSRPADCEMRILREWLQITCRGPYTGFEKMENFGQISRDYFESIQSGRMASFVVRLQKGQTQKLRICAPGRSSSLFVNWPDSAERPLHIALGKGSECERDQEEEEDE